MPVSHADSERQNAAASGQSAPIARISKSPAFMRTASETEPKSMDFCSGAWDVRLIAGRQFGSMAEKVADFEKLLKYLSLRVGEEDAAQIRLLLEQVSTRFGRHLPSLTIFTGCLSRAGRCIARARLDQLS
jgi:hypothetical protein